MGEAQQRIRDKKLYKNEYASFERYCQERWGFGRSQRSRYICAAEVHQTLGAIPGIPMPECEAQVRPLIGLPAELAQQAWLNAPSRTRNGHVPARLVKRAVKQVLKTAQPALAAKSNADRKQRSRQRQSVRTGFQELLALLLGSTASASFGPDRASRKPWDRHTASARLWTGLLDPFDPPREETDPWPLHRRQQATESHSGLRGLR